MQLLQTVLSAAELNAFRDVMRGGAFIDGKLTAGSTGAHIKNNLQLNRGDPGSAPLDQILHAALSRHGQFQSGAFPSRYSAPIYSKYTVGMNYGAHVDASHMGPVGAVMRSDLSMTIFLNEPADYDGGELVLESTGTNFAIKLPAGNAVVYPTYLVHKVNPVTRGERQVCVLWVQSLIRDPAMRQVLSDMQSLLVNAFQRQHDSPESTLLQKCYGNLMRLVIDA